MNAFADQFHNRLELGEPQTNRNLTLIPVIAKSPGGVVFYTLAHALDQGFSITEVDDGGSVPEVHANNRLDKPVLILAGEELIGAQQNRVSNTTVFIQEQTETVIPVSCTEQGRWSSVSDEFSDSGYMMPPSIRARKTVSVANSLREGQRRNSAQNEVWSAIDDLATDANVHRPTGAMRDVFLHSEPRLREMIEPFAASDNQVGVVALVNGNVVGMDCVSSPAAYQALASKLLKSYALEALVDETPLFADDAIKHANAFLAETESCNETMYPGVSLGDEYRYESQTAVGAALIHRDELLHASFHRIAPPVPFSRSYWVRPGKFLAGFYPGAPSKQEAEDKLKRLLGAGIRCVINLVEEEEKGTDGQPLRPYYALLAKLATQQGIDVTYLRIPIKDVDIPSQKTMEAILGAIDEAHAREQPVYVHCWGGRGRTGTVVGCYLAKHGIAVGEDALRMIERLRRREETAGKSSPETEAQREMVRTWAS